MNIGPNPNGSTTRLRRFGRAFPPALGLAPLAIAALLVGCTPFTSTFSVVDYRLGEGPSRFVETFPEAYYDLDSEGRASVVLRRTTPGKLESTGAITQVIYMRSFWRPVPGVNISDATQINATVSYVILMGESASSYDGTGMVYFKENKSEDAIIGSLDLAVLRPTRQAGNGAALFQNAEVAGRFRARRDGRQVTRIINEMESIVGPLPANFPSPTPDR